MIPIPTSLGGIIYTKLDIIYSAGIKGLSNKLKINKSLALAKGNKLLFGITKWDHIIYRIYFKVNVN